MIEFVVAIHWLDPEDFPINYKLNEYAWLYPSSTFKDAWEQVKWLLEQGHGVLPKSEIVLKQTRVDKVEWVQLSCNKAGEIADPWNPTDEELDSIVEFAKLAPGNLADNLVEAARRMIKSRSSSHLLNVLFDLRDRIEGNIDPETYQRFSGVIDDIDYAVNENDDYGLE